METTACNLCGSAAADPVCEVYDYWLGLKDVHSRFVRCRDCSLVYQNPRPTREEIGRAYPPEYEPHAAPSDNPFKRRLYRYGLRQRTGYVTRNHPGGGRLLEIGSGAGEFLAAMTREPGWSVAGVELVPETAERARQKHGLTIYTGTLENTPLDPASYDAVALWDVLEHLHDPKAGLERIARLLRPGGILVLRVPNLDSWDAWLFGKLWAGFDAPRHLYVFSPHTLAAILQAAGFSIVEQSCRLGSYPAFVVSVQFWMTNRGYSLPSRRRVTRLLHHPLTAALASPVLRMLSNGLRGSQLTVVAKKIER